MNIWFCYYANNLLKLERNEKIGQSKRVSSQIQTGDSLGDRRSIDEAQKDLRRFEEEYERRRAESWSEGDRSPGSKI